MAGGWKPHIVTMIQSYGQKINDSPVRNQPHPAHDQRGIAPAYIDVPATLAAPVPAATPAPVSPRGRSLNREQQAL